MADTGEQLAAAMSAGAPPARGGDLIAYAGGKRELQQALSGMERAPKRSDYGSPEGYDAARRTWRTAARRVQRFSADEGKQRRGQTRTVLAPAQRDRVERAGDEHKQRAIRRRGMRARMFARVRIASASAKGGGDERDRIMPAPPGPGVLFPGPAVEDIFDQAGGDIDAAGALFEAEFLERYGLDAEFQITTVYWLRLWPDGEREPGT